MNCMVDNIINYSKLQYAYVSMTTHITTACVLLPVPVENISLILYVCTISYIMISFFFVICVGNYFYLLITTGCNMENLTFSHIIYSSNISV